MTKLKIKVTKGILERSKGCKAGEQLTHNCAVSLAIRDIFPYADTGYSWISPFGDDLLDSLDDAIGLPQAAIDFIKEFDKETPEHRAAMPELEFEVEIPDSVIEKINIEELKPLLENHPTLELVQIK